MLYHIETKENIWISSKNARYFKRIFENREFVRCLYEQHMALGQAFITFIDVAESSRRFFDAIVDILNEAFPDVDDKSGISLPGETGLVIKCLDGLIAVCGSSGEKLAKLQTENRGIAYLLKNNATFSEKLSFVETVWKATKYSLMIYAMRLKGFLKK